MNTAEANQGLIHRTRTVVRGLAIASLTLAAALTLTPADASAQAREELIVPAGQSEVLDVGARYTDLMIADPEVADVLPLSDRSIYVVGKKPGTTALSIYGPGKRLLSVAMITVGANSSGLKQRLYEILPEETGISVSPAGDRLVLSGPVSSGARLQQALTLAEAFAPNKVVNMMSVQGSQQVMLTVRFVELERSVAKGLGINVRNHDIRSRLQDNRPFITTGDNFSGVLLDSFGLAQLRFRHGDVDLDILFDALEERGLAKTLAQPTLVAMSGDTASFLAGGEFPIPVAQNSDSEEGVITSSITVEFKQFGISLAFTPTVLDDGVINLVVAPEVSDIDPTATVTTGGITVPGMKVSRAKTTVELRDGESFTIAGLLRDDYQNTVRQFPVIGDLPILGPLFRSTSYQRNQTELVMVVTPHLAAPTRGRQATPVDYFTPPSDFELFVFGAQQGLGNGANPEDRALMGLDPTKVGVEGSYGHVLF